MIRRALWPTLAGALFLAVGIILGATIAGPHP